MTADERYERGLEHLRTTQGEKVATRIEEALKAVSPSFAEYSISSTYGEVYPRDRLELRSRQLVTIAILATLGGCEQQLKLHVRAGLCLGIAGDEIVETIIQVAAYAGAPRASNAFLAASEVFERDGVSVA